MCCETTQFIKLIDNHTNSIFFYYQELKLLWLSAFHSLQLEYLQLSIYRTVRYVETEVYRLINDAKECN